MAGRTRTTAKHGGSEPAPAIDWNGPIMTVDEAIDRYPGQWMLMIVLEKRDGWPEKGRLIAHSQSRQEIDEIEMAAIRARPDPGGVYSMFEGYHLIRTGEELGRLLDEIWERAVAGEISEEELDKHFDLHSY
ncbi:MAG TPA: hypothetical protein VKQ30_24870 [Ktedonobacterales bacterium]|nr:hypothetical protein [Ktedonobacterales bacterium]